MAMAVDRFGSYIGVLPILRYSVIEKNILPPDILYVIFLHWDKNQVYYNIERTLNITYIGNIQFQKFYNSSTQAFLLYQ